jgi:NADH-quinone oxidoreductase subunit H
MMEELANGLIGLLPFLGDLPRGLLLLISSVAAAVAVILFISLFVMAAIWVERKLSAHMQDRLGPMVVGGWHGWAQSIADAVKLLMKEDIIPRLADRRLFMLAPLIVFSSSFAAFAALPFGKGIVASDLDIGLFYILAVTSMVTVGIIMGGWASNNKWSLLGAMRSAAQIVSYEIPVGLSVLTVVMVVGSLNLHEIVGAQAGGFWNWYAFPLKNPFTFLAFVMTFVASLAEVNRTPFDIPEAESEIVAGYHTEYSGMKFAFFFLAEYADMFLVSALAAILFLGGWEGPFGGVIPLPGVVWFLLKASSLVLVQIWMRWSLPRLRVDQLMYVSWKVLTPFALANVFLLGLWMVM